MIPQKQPCTTVDCGWANGGKVTEFSNKMGKFIVTVIPGKDRWSLENRKEGLNVEQKSQSQLKTTSKCSTVCLHQISWP